MKFLNTEGLRKLLTDLKTRFAKIMEWTGDNFANHEFVAVSIAEALQGIELGAGGRHWDEWQQIEFESTDYGVINIYFHDENGNAIETNQAGLFGFGAYVQFFGTVISWSGLMVPDGNAYTSTVIGLGSPYFVRMYIIPGDRQGYYRGITLKLYDQNSNPVEFNPIGPGFVGYSAFLLGGSGTGGGFVAPDYSNAETPISGMGHGVEQWTVEGDGFVQTGVFVDSGADTRSLISMSINYTGVYGDTIVSFGDMYSAYSGVFPVKAGDLISITHNPSVQYGFYASLYFTKPN